MTGIAASPRKLIDFIIVSGVSIFAKLNITPRMEAQTIGYFNGSSNAVLDTKEAREATNTLTVEDSLIEVGLVDGSAPGSDLNIDLGLILNYYTGSAKKAAIYWDDSTSRITVGSDVSETSSVITATTYAPLEIGQLWVNDCAGQSQVISCTGSERFLENITIDGGSF